MAKIGCRVFVLGVLCSLAVKVRALDHLDDTTFAGENQHYRQQRAWQDDRLSTFSSWGRVLQQEVCSRPSEHIGLFCMRYLEVELLLMSPSEASSLVDDHLNVDIAVLAGIEYSDAS